MTGYDLQVRQGQSGAWLTWLGNPPLATAFFAGQPGKTYYFRVRARAEQPVGTSDPWPPHSYVGEWSAPAPVSFVQPNPCFPAAFLPLMER